MRTLKIKLKEVRLLVSSILKESICTKCGYDNPFMDDDPNYVCRQCRMRAEKLGGQPIASHVEAELCARCSDPADDLYNGLCPECRDDGACKDCGAHETLYNRRCEKCDLSEWDCEMCGAAGIVNDHGSCPKCGAPRP